MIKSDHTQLFLVVRFSEVLLIFIEDNWVLLPLVGKCIIPPANPFSYRIALLIIVIICQIVYSDFSVLMELEVRLISIARKLLRTGFSIIIILFCFV